MPFNDRKQAGEMLAEEFSDLAGEDVLVLAIPRGGIAVAEPIAKSLRAELDLIVTRKIPVPGNPEVAIGSLSPSGKAIYDEKRLARLGLRKEDVKDIEDEQRRELERRLQAYRGDRPFPDVSGRHVLLIDDGMATGMTMQAAVDGLQGEKPGRISIGIPVAPHEVLKEFQRKVDRIECLEVPGLFLAVGQAFRRFEQVSDEQVISILQSYSEEGD